MAIKDILLHLDASVRAEVRMRLAVDLAARHEAHLTAVYVLDLPPPDMFAGYPTVFVELARSEDVVERMRTVRVAEAETLQAQFSGMLERAGVKGGFRIVEGEPAESVALHGRYADLIVVGQPEPGRSAGAIDPGELMAAGRPLLVVPFAGNFEVMGKTVLVGWNATPEAARAVNDAIPLLRMAERVVVLSINPKLGIGGDGDVPAADMALHLARHGIHAEAAHTVAADIGEGDALLSYAADISADLLVTGMYGHSRLREFTFGGVTRSLITEMTLPTFMVH